MRGITLECDVRVGLQHEGRVGLSVGDVVGITETEGVEVAGESADPPVSFRGGGKILIVDDNAHNLIAFSSMLESLGAPIITAESGDDALRCVLKEEPALILMDVQMPGLDGFDTVRLIRSRERSRSVPIIFLTALQRDERYVARGYSVGAVDYLVKPVDPDILRSKVEVFLELHRKNAIIREQAEQLRRASEQKLADYQRWSEDRYRSLADTVPELVWTADAEGKLSYRNRRWEECAEVEAPDLDFRDVIHTEDLPIFEQKRSAAHAAKSAWEAELRFGSRTKQLFRWHLVRVVPTRAPSGEVDGWVGTSTDIDEQKRSQQALAMLAELTRRLGELSEGAGVLEEVLALGLPVLGDAALLAFTAEDLTRSVSVSRPDCRVPPLDDARLDFVISTVAFTRQADVILDVAAELELANEAKPQSRLLAELGIRSYVCVPLISRDRVLGTLAFFTAGSGRRYTEEDVRLVEDVARRVGTAIENLHLYCVAERERLKLAEASRAKDIFLATLSHELRTPLNAIVGWTHLLKTGAVLAGQSARAIETIDRNARTLAKLVGDLIDVSRIVTGSLNVDEKKVDLRQVVESAVQAVRASADAAGLVLSTELDERPLRVAGDYTRLQQVLGNVLANSIRFTPQGGKIEVRLSLGEIYAILQVRDTGHGIAPEFLPSVFEPFRQARRTHARSQEGLGLGLAIVRHLVELHGGRVRAESAGVERGSTITIELPLGGALSPSDVPPRAQTVLDAPSSVLSSLESTLHGVRIVVVEDDPDGCELLQTVLESLGAIVSSAHTAAEAYAALCREKPDVLISDIGLPGEDGLSLMRRVRATPGLASIPAIALTAYASKRDVAQALSAGFHAHVAKPVEPGALGRAIAASLR